MEENYFFSFSPQVIKKKFSKKKRNIGMIQTLEIK